MDFNEIEFLAEKELVTVVPNFSEDKITLVTGDYGPFNPSMPTTVPLWLAVSLKKQQRCHIQPPEWLNVDMLTQKKQDEKESELFVEMPSNHFIEIATILLDNASDDITQPDEVRALIKDISDARAAKLKKGIVDMVVERATHGKVDNLTPMEVTSVRSFLTQSLDQLHILRSHANQHATQT
ncbi:PREDICTED: DNA replication complex GINS protein PSF2-like [Amphimedon queenslandica]|uniref:DNA replication complex GINS protein PSF2 n=1 Tax=Amphimedon queenslandica TaxID=400682 RepID=A0A1X7VEC3_AMPQE|nr:PREDICTED: DNA replication complex GINS protein PSF2-like [Amphimedon queenslandica]|eukprot:XP_003384647.1 PREDICTED: DNA replication complex GINS protein PSF2-like [Amphimedon queenslandica]